MKKGRGGLWLLLSVAILAPATSAAPSRTTASIVTWGRNVIVAQSDLENLVAVATGTHHSLALKEDGTIVAWGENDFGRCDIPSPNADFVAVAAGYYHSLGLKGGGTGLAWGRNDNGECNVPAPNADFIAAATGWMHNLGLRSDGAIVAWGDDLYSQCVVPAPNADFVAIAAGADHSMGLKSDGSIVVWGRLWPVRRPRPQCRLRTDRGGRVSQPSSEIQHADGRYLRQLLR